MRETARAGDALFLCEPRGVRETRWTEKNPPNYVKRSHALLGRTVDTDRVWDIIATARAIRERRPTKRPLLVMGEGANAVLAAYAALWEPDIDGVIARHPPLTHMSNAAPQFLNVLRVCDVPEIIGMLAPRPVTMIAPKSAATEKVAAIYRAAGAKNFFKIQADSAYLK
jgi:hypothetical protein